MMMNENAAAMPRYGMLRAETSFLTFLTATDAATIKAPNSGMYVCGLR
jgi:hypothetical protein